MAQTESAMAEEPSIIIHGGLLLAMLSIPEHRKQMDHLNKAFDEAKKQWESYGIRCDVEPMKLRIAPGFFLNARYVLTEALMVGGEFERFSRKTTGGYYAKDHVGDYVEEEFTLSLGVNGLSALAHYQVHEMATVFGGAGYYFGRAAFDYSYRERIGGSYKAEDETLLETGLGGFGLRLGSSINYPIQSAIAAALNIEYRMLNLRFRNKDYFGYNVDRDSFSGLRLSGGLSFSF